MSEQNDTETTPTLTPEDAELLEQLKELEAKGFSLSGVLAQHAQVQQKARSLEVDSIIAALEGKGQRDDVTVIDGHRHYPAVIQAVEVALRSAHEGLGMDIGEQGKTQIDELILNIINALPAEARMCVDGKPSRPDRSVQATEADDLWQKPQHRTEPMPADVAERVTDEAIDRFTEGMALGG